MERYDGSRYKNQFGRPFTAASLSPSSGLQMTRVRLIWPMKVKKSAQGYGETSSKNTPERMNRASHCEKVAIGVAVTGNISLTCETYGFNE